MWVSGCPQPAGLQDYLELEGILIDRLDASPFVSGRSGGWRQTRPWTRTGAAPASLHPRFPHQKRRHGAGRRQTRRGPEHAAADAQVEHDGHGERVDLGEAATVFSSSSLVARRGPSRNTMASEQTAAATMASMMRKTRPHGVVGEHIDVPCSGGMQVTSTALLRPRRPSPRGSRWRGRASGMSGPGSERLCRRPW